MNGANHSPRIVQNLWICRDVLRDDDLSYGDYVEPPGVTSCPSPGWPTTLAVTEDALPRTMVYTGIPCTGRPS